MDKQKLFDFLDKATDAAVAAAPLAAILGIPFVEKAAGWADFAVEVGKMAIENGMIAGEVLNSQDEDFINGKVAELEAIAESLSQQVDAS